MKGSALEVKAKGKLKEMNENCRAQRLVYTLK